MLKPKRKASYRKMVPSLIGGQVLAMLISLMVSSLLGRFENSYIIAAMYIICLVFGLFFSYHEGWIAGASDKIYINSKQIDFIPSHGFIAGAIASILNLVIAFLAFLSAITPLGEITVMGQAVFEIVYRIWFWAFSVIFNAIEAVPILHFLPVVAMPLACGFGYIAGVKGFRLSEYIFYKKDNK